MDAADVALLGNFTEASEDSFRKTLRTVGVPEATAEAPPREGVPLADYFRIRERLAIAAHDETCQISARPLMLGTTDFVLASLTGSKTIKDAMERIAKSYNVAHGGAFNRVWRRAGRLVYAIDDADFPYVLDRSGALVHSVMEGVLIFLHAMLSQAAGGDLSRRLITVRTKRPRRTAPDGFLSFWEAQIRCGAPQYALEYEGATAEIGFAPVRSGPISAADVYERVAAMIAAREQRHEDADFPGRVVRWIEAGVDDQGVIAERLGVSVATLRRRLAEAGETFRDLRQRVLNATAKDRLSRREPQGEVAAALGFSDVRSFARAFKDWNGLTPTEFAAQCARAAPAGTTRGKSTPK